MTPDFNFVRNSVVDTLGGSSSVSWVPSRVCQSAAHLCFWELIAVGWRDRNNGPLDLLSSSRLAWAPSHGGWAGFHDRE